MDTLTVFTSADKNYEMFVLPYICSVLLSNPENAKVEICLQNSASFASANIEAMHCLQNAFTDRFQLSDADFSRLRPHTIRFVTTPTIVSNYVYIGDIDIIVTEEIAKPHLEKMKETKLPYSNIKRPNKNSLSGLHFSEWTAYYPLSHETPSDRINLDEAYLWDLVSARGHRMPDPGETFRPIHGLHLSMNRDPRTIRTTWGGVRQKPTALGYVRLRTHDVWKQLAPFFDEKFKRMTFVLDSMIAARYAEEIERFEFPNVIGLGQMINPSARNTQA